jgi:ferrous iron transport protein A
MFNCDRLLCVSPKRGIQKPRNAMPKQPKSLAQDLARFKLKLSLIPERHLFQPLMPHTVDPFRPKRMPLNELPDGAIGRVCELCGEAGFCARLREMGFGETALIEKIGGAKTLLCQLYQTRIALSERAARYIIVEMVRLRA